MSRALTKKAKAAIETYVRLNIVHAPYIYTAVKLTLAADRMKRQDLYDWLSQHGHIWDSKLRRWRLKK